ncbi:hypothetical protein Val02_49660 [Virgisporangium aliadipatigenens]|uniref:BON domain-containing protein n=1 Tax=Virgisporangium aliadipatigenens TaxID=741659 RepID=A0A8J3YQF5_9ACTN|nr:BON domain-containing protein [Virgisporangium aliadipatigenens]GIJ48080.1 hypothetical protein Val02_49660 [Virgisporangium aliadipatigenens]
MRTLTVHEVFRTIPGDHLSDLRADVHHGVVVLFGTVHERVTAERIAHAVAHVDGVASVVNAVAYRRDTVPPAASGRAVHRHPGNRRRRVSARA